MELIKCIFCCCSCCNHICSPNAVWEGTCFMPHATYHDTLAGTHHVVSASFALWWLIILLLFQVFLHCLLQRSVRSLCLCVYVCFGISVLVLPTACPLRAPSSALAKISWTPGRRPAFVSNRCNGNCQSSHCNAIMRFYKHRQPSHTHTKIHTNTCVHMHCGWLCVRLCASLAIITKASLHCSWHCFKS